MSEKNRIKSEMKSEREKLKHMSFRDKLWYIGEYYKFHILGLIAILAVGWVIGTSLYRGTFDNVLYVMYLNNPSQQDINSELLTKDFHDYMGFTDKQLISTESTYISFEGSSELGYAAMIKISALVASRTLDVMIGDQGNFDHYAALGGFLDLKQALPADVLALVKDRLIYAADDTGTTHALGISLDGTKFAEESHLTQSPCILSLVSSTAHTDTSAAMIRYIFSL